MQQTGLEWLWRIKEEPYLWKRYYSDGATLLRLLYSHVLPLTFDRLNPTRKWGIQEAHLAQIHDDKNVTIRIYGSAVDGYLNKFIPAFRHAIATKKGIIIDLSNTSSIRFHAFSDYCSC